MDSKKCHYCSKTTETIYVIADLPIKPVCPDCLPQFKVEHEDNVYIALSLVSLRGTRKS